MGWGWRGAADTWAAFSGLPQGAPPAKSPSPTTRGKCIFNIHSSFLVNTILVSL